MNFLAVGVCLGLVSGVAVGQSFPIRALSEPLMPASEDDPLAYAWESGMGTMERVGDVNGDGVEDLVVLFLNEASDIEERLMYLYLGARGEDGSVSFGDGELVTGFETGGFEITNFELHDHDGDGLDDLVVLTNEWNALEIWLSTRDAFEYGDSFDSPQSISIDLQRLLIEDIDADGDFDYLIYNSNNARVGTWWNQGGGDSYVFELIEYEVQNGLSRLALIDADGDGDLDLIELDPFSNYLEMLERTADGWSEEAVEIDLYATNNFYFEGFACFADVNGDGSLDVVAKGDSSTDHESRWGFGFFLSPFDLDKEREVPFTGIPDIENQYSVAFVGPDVYQDHVLRSAGDLDGDGTADLVYYPFEGKTSGWRIQDPMNLNGRFSVSNELSVHGEGAIRMAWVPESDRYAYREMFSDVNGDGIKDKIVATFAQRTDVLEVEDGMEAPGLMVWGVLGNPFDPRVVFDQQDAMGLRSDANHVLTADLDGDEDPEILYTSDVYIKAVDRDVDGLFKEFRAIDFRGTPAGFRSVVASMDGDPTPDILSLGLGRNAQAPVMFLNPMAMPFGEGVRNDAVEFDPILYVQLDVLGVQFECIDNSFAVGDVDGDGINDVVLRGEAIVHDTDKHEEELYSGEAVISWIGDGVGGLTYGAVSPIRDLRSLRTYNMELIDFNRDGLMDVVSVGDENVDEGYVLQVLMNEGDGAFGLVQEVVIDETVSRLFPYWMEIEDLDGDGYQDVMVLLKNDRDLHEVAIVYGMEAGLSTEAAYVYGGNAAEVIAVDLDGDGLRDLLTCSYQSDSGGLLKNSVSMMFQNAPREFGPIVSINDLDMSTVNVADLNRDGGLDLIAGAISTASSNIGPLLRVFYSVPAACEADLNLDGALDFFDLSLFVRLLGEQRAIVDLNRDQVWNFGDVSAFLELFTDGCAGGGL